MIAWRQILSWKNLSPNLDHPDESWIGHKFKRLAQTGSNNVYWTAIVTGVEKRNNYDNEYLIKGQWVRNNSEGVQTTVMYWNSIYAPKFECLE
jgi:hypothetical protein